jgi:hypothetical protein
MNKLIKSAICCAVLVANSLPVLAVGPLLSCPTRLESPISQTQQHSPEYNIWAAVERGDISIDMYLGTFIENLKAHRYGKIGIYPLTFDRDMIVYKVNNANILLAFVRKDIGLMRLIAVVEPKELAESEKVNDLMLIFRKMGTTYMKDNLCIVPSVSFSPDNCFVAAFNDSETGKATVTFAYTSAIDFINSLGINQ